MLENASSRVIYSCRNKKISGGTIAPDPVFSRNFSSAGKRRFMAGKAQDMCQRRTFLGGGGIVE